MSRIKLMQLRRELTFFRIFSHLSSRLRHSNIFLYLSFLDRRDKRILLSSAILQAFLSLLDLGGIAIVGVLGALAVVGVQSGSPGNRVSKVIEILNLENFRFQTQIGILGCIAAGLLIFRTILSIYFTRKTLHFLSSKGTKLTNSLFGKLLNQSLLKIQERSIQQTLYAISDGVNAIALGIIGTSIMLIADFAMLVVIALGLFIIDPVTAILSLGLFSSVGLILYLQMHTRAHRLGALNSTALILSSNLVSEVIVTYREAVLRGTRHAYSSRVSGLRKEISGNLAEIQFMPYISKYVIETSVIFGSLLIAGTQFYLQDASHAIATLSIFLAAGTRIGPSIMRIQQGGILIRTSIGSSAPTLEIIREIFSDNEIENLGSKMTLSHEGFTPNVKISNLFLRYPKADKFALNGIDLEVKTGEAIAIVGPSGSGKTSLIDVLLGAIPRTSGEIEISGMDLSEIVQKWPGCIGYVPQEVTIINGSIRENIALGLIAEDISEDRFWACIETAQLMSYVQSQALGLDTQLGDGGARLSGGQRQRLGIARALITNPLILVMDEATSALDADTESAITRTFDQLKGHLTRISVAHRLSTVMNADKIFYLEAGSIIACGNFSEVRTLVPDFDRQANLMGII